MKKNIGRKFRITAYVEESAYLALKKIADPEPEEVWESRMARKVFSEFLDRHAPGWRDNIKRQDRVDGDSQVNRKRESRTRQGA